MVTKETFRRKAAAQKRLQWSNIFRDQLRDFIMACSEYGGFAYEISEFPDFEELGLFYRYSIHLHNHEKGAMQICLDLHEDGHEKEYLLYRRYLDMEVGQTYYSCNLFEGIEKFLIFFMNIKKIRPYTPKADTYRPSTEIGEALTDIYKENAKYRNLLGLVDYEGTNIHVIYFAYLDRQTDTKKTLRVTIRGEEFTMYSQNIVRNTDKFFNGVCNYLSMLGYRR